SGAGLLGQPLPRPRGSGPPQLPAPGARAAAREAAPGRGPARSPRAELPGDGRQASTSRGYRQEPDQPRPRGAGAASAPRSPAVSQVGRAGAHPAHGGEVMQLAVERTGDVQVVRVREGKLTYPVLSSFFGEVRQLVDAGAR